MHRRELVAAAAALPFATACRGLLHARGGNGGGGAQLMTATGLVDAAALGISLAHEHLFADLRPFAEQTDNPLPPDTDDVLRVVLPHLRDIRKLGCRTVVDCTATTLGRDAALLRRLSECMW